MPLNTSYSNKCAILSLTVAFLPSCRMSIASPAKRFKMAEGGVADAIENVSGVADPKEKDVVEVKVSVY